MVIYILYKKESCKLNSCEWFLDRPIHFLNEWIPVMGLHSVGTETSRYPQVFHALTGCQRDPRVLGCHRKVRGKIVIFSFYVFLKKNGE